MQTARDFMTESVISVSPETPLLNVLRLFVQEDIHGAPVVDDAGEFVGVISTSDLLQAEADERDTARSAPDYLRDFLEFSAPDSSASLNDFQDRLSQQTVGEVMTKALVGVATDAPLEEIASCFHQNQIHRVWVLEEGRVCGVISALDLMPAIEQLAKRG
ncbi:MAG: CBS domain-containing protein [Myxococcota bacterium]|jgi:CBS domain-containing protein|nr:CBS domain-containing protein [Myxococcota bacterium]